MLRYSTNVMWSPEDQGFIALCPELGDVSAFGATREEALSELSVAMDLNLGFLADSGKPIPEPDVARAVSGQFVARIPRYLHARLVAQARRNRTSLNSLVTTYLAEASTQAHTLEFVGRRLQEFGYRAIAAVQESASLARGGRKIVPYSSAVEVGSVLRGEPFARAQRQDYVHVGLPARDQSLLDEEVVA